MSQLEGKVRKNYMATNKAESATGRNLNFDFNAWNIASWEMCCGSAV